MHEDSFQALPGVSSVCRGAALRAGADAADAARQGSSSSGRSRSRATTRRSGARCSRGQPNYTSIPRARDGRADPAAGRFLGRTSLTAGETWRQFRNGPVTFYGGWLVVLVLLAILAALYFAFGPVKLHDRPTGRLIHRFSPLEQIVHWSHGDQLLRARPVRADHAVRQARAAAGHRLHAVRLAHRARPRTCTTSSRRSSSSRCCRSSCCSSRDNLPRAYDLKWFAQRLGGMSRGKEHCRRAGSTPARRLVLGRRGGAVASWWPGAALILLFPNFDQTRAMMQEAWIWHAIAALLYIALVARPHLPRHASAWKAPTRRCAPATSTRPGRRSTTSTGTTK